MPIAMAVDGSTRTGCKLKVTGTEKRASVIFVPIPIIPGGFPENVYGGLIASLMDCHGAGTAAAAKARSEGIDPETEQFKRFVTASLKIDYLAPTPVDATMELRGKVRTMDGRKVVVDISLTADEKIRAKGEVLMIQLLDHQ